MKEEPLKLVTYINHSRFIEYGDYILFQEYKRNDDCSYTVTKPILVLYLGAFAADQTIGFEYIKWNKDCSNRPNKIDEHVEWSNYINILGHWKRKPNWKDIIKAYRKQNTKSTVHTFDIIVNYGG